MASLNKAPKSQFTHEGATSQHISPDQQLRRSVMACMLWESEFYESGETIAKRIQSIIPEVDPFVCASIAVEAREKMKLRHVPLLIVREMARLATHKKYVKATLEKIIQRPDELSEFVSLYWKEKKQPLSGQVKKGLAAAFSKFNEYQLAKYNRDREIKLRDVLFLCHAKPKNADQEQLFKKLVDGTLATPDTWEVELSASKDKKASWERLLLENKLGGLALLRNLRNMKEAKIPDSQVQLALQKMKTNRILPYRFIAASKFAPQLEPALEEAMFRCLNDLPKMKGITLLMVDVSGSMDEAISSKSDLKRIDAACGLAMLLREQCESVGVWTFSNGLAQVPGRRGFALRDSILMSQPHQGTYLGAAMTKLKELCHDKIERLIVITDEQSADKVPAPFANRGYMINVASARNGVGYGAWNHLDGWSEAIVSYIQELESSSDR